MTLLYTLSTDKYESNEYSNFGSATVYNNCVDELKKHDDVINIYDYYYKHKCNVKIDRIVINGDQTLSPKMIDGRLQYFDALKKTNLKYITMSSSIGDDRLGALSRNCIDVLNNCIQPLHLREVSDEMDLPCVLSLDQAFWKDASYYKCLMQLYKDLKPGEFTFEYQPWNSPNATKPFFQFNVDSDVKSIAEYDNKLGYCKANPLNLSYGNWLWLLANCKTLYTSSYHAFAFATMFNRRIVCPNIKARRFRCTMKLLGMRMSSDGCIENHDEVVKNIEKERKKVLNYIDEIYSDGFDKTTPNVVQVSVKSVPKNDKPKNDTIKPVYFNCKAKDEIVANLSASGAISALLANAILKRGGLVYGAMYTRDFKQVKVDWVDTIYDYYKHIAKSKYVYSMPPKFKDIKKKLDLGKTILIGALPCQIIALRKYLGRDYENLYAMSLKCHGGTKPTLYREFVERIENENDSKVFSADFRKNHGSAFHVRFENGVVKTYSLDTFMNNNTEQCGNCKVKWGNDFTDFVVGDYWEYKNNKETMFDPNLTVKDGISYLKVCTKKGLDLFNQVKEHLNCKEFDITKIKWS